MLSQEERKQMILKLFIALKESNIFPGYTPVQIKEAAIRAEQRIYEESSSKEEYLRGMGERFRRIERVVSNRNKNDGRGKNMQEQAMAYMYTKPQAAKGQEFVNASGETQTSRQDYTYGNGRFERGERRLSEQLFTENKQLFGKQDGFAPPEIIGITRNHGLEESDNIARFNDRDMESSTRGRSNSCNIQGSLHDSMGHAISGEGFSNSPGNPIFFRRPQAEAGSYSFVNRKDFQNIPGQRNFYMQREGNHQGMPSQSYGYANQGFNPEFSRFDYGGGNPNVRHKDEALSKSTIDMNFGEIQQSKLPGGGVFNGRGFTHLQYPQQFGRVSSPTYQNPGNMNAFPFSGKPVYGNQGTFGPSNHSIPSHKHPSRMINGQGYHLPSTSDTIGGFSHQNPPGRPVNMFSIPPQNRNSPSAEWMINSPTFDRHYPNSGQGAVKPPPIFFNQQVQHQPYFHGARNPGHLGPGIDRKEVFSVPENPNQWMFNSPGENPRIPYDEFLRRNKDPKKNTEYLSSSKKEEGNFSVDAGGYKPNSPSSWSPGGFRNFFPEDSLPCSSDPPRLQKRADNSLWFKEDTRYNINSEPIPSDNSTEKVRDSYSMHEKGEGTEYNNTTSTQHHPGQKETLQDRRGTIDQEQPFVFPGEVCSFFREHEMERIYLDYQELSNLKSRLSEAINVIAKSQKIHNAFKEAFPGSELLQKYEAIKNLLEKQEEYLKYDAYFLKPRSVDGFIDQIKSLTVDMSHDLKLNTTDTGDVNYGECLMNAVKAFSERKKKEEAFGLNVVDKDAYE
ncbi:hypothetical protein EHEL_071710 [Encephalitozoon hellem ATCC 50504]|uniref:Mediator complex subunit 15 KIX domain-containing protein n=1 Tax=Encephalitozoon hellem TaxID=27973 RepID=A0A9Q9F8N1_ENCHE|nr:uncharacterized protein EHEL_071710 [Encephalitozoon hellem ATCC 50504]AFM98693.1 hypothetical protein EHEL_071710 [Encephalitozoon hellem ATCC 50504]UTX43643.1 hypothetical protein GPU96_07g14070 [Encephalitozoon hellem]WEL39119.1 hypothetical protein PFJ87_07g02020 [Encephalitozoon hellem]|eukprot:XP_003887674.1 hypothetical protein EHEL_071710 [Encephalitozoon hellem ATCC 50504]